MIAKHIAHTYMVFSKHRKEGLLKTLKKYYEDPSGYNRLQLVWEMLKHSRKSVKDANETILKILDPYNVFNPIVAEKEKQIDIDIDRETIDSIIDSNKPDVSDPGYMLRRIGKK